MRPPAWRLWHSSYKRADACSYGSILFARCGGGSLASGVSAQREARTSAWWKILRVRSGGTAAGAARPAGAAQYSVGAAHQQAEGRRLVLGSSGRKLREVLRRGSPALLTPMWRAALLKNNQQREGSANRTTSPAGAICRRVAAASPATVHGAEARRRRLTDTPAPRRLCRAARSISASVPASATSRRASLTSCQQYPVAPRRCAVQSAELSKPDSAQVRQSLLTVHAWRPRDTSGRCHPSDDAFPTMPALHARETAA
jgi:hypothetical protein